MPTVYLALGSNLGDRVAYLRRALAALPPAVTVRRVSPLYETAPVGYAEQGPFLNGVAEGETALTPEALLAHLKAVEHDLGRVPTVRYGPRVVDLDILSYDGLVMDSPNLVLPHPHIAARAFVLVPLAALAPDWRDPRSGKTARDLLAALGLEPEPLRVPRGGGRPAGPLHGGGEGSGEVPVVVANDETLPATDSSGGSHPSLPATPPFSGVTFFQQDWWSP